MEGSDLHLQLSQSASSDFRSTCHYYKSQSDNWNGIDDQQTWLNRLNRLIYEIQHLFSSEYRNKSSFQTCRERCNIFHPIIKDFDTPPRVSLYLCQYWLKRPSSHKKQPSQCSPTLMPLHALTYVTYTCCPPQKHSYPRSPIGNHKGQQPPAHYTS